MSCSLYRLYNLNIREYLFWIKKQPLFPERERRLYNFFLIPIKSGEISVHF